MMMIVSYKYAVKFEVFPLKGDVISQSRRIAYTVGSLSHTKFGF